MSMMKEFRDFAVKGNAIDMAVGIVIGAAFGSIVKSLVDNVIMPPIGLLLGGVDFSNLFLVLKEGTKQAGPYETLTQATSAGAVTLSYGVFVNTIISFIIIAFSVFLLVKVINKAKNSVVKVNFPACAPEDVAGVLVTRQGKRNLGFLKIEERRDGRGNPYFWIGFERAAMMDTPAKGTDLAALAARCVSVTPLRLDRTDDVFAEALTATLK